MKDCELEDGRGIILILNSIKFNNPDMCKCSLLTVLLHFIHLASRVSILPTCRYVLVKRNYSSRAFLLDVYLGADTRN